MPAPKSFAKNACAAGLGAMLALGCLPVAMPATAFAAPSAADLSVVEATIGVYMTSGAASAVTENAAVDITAAMDKYKVGVDDLPSQYQVYVLKCQLLAAQTDLQEANADLASAQKEKTDLSGQVAKLKKQLSQAQAQVDAMEAQEIKTQVKVSSLKATASGMGKVTLSWKVRNPVSGMLYQVRYGTSSSKLASSATAKTTKQTISGLAGGKTYTFQVRAYKELSGKNVYSAPTKKASASVAASYRTGTYRVRADMLHVRKTASTSSDLLVDIKNGTRVKVKKLNVVNGVAWGKLTYAGQTGWVQMQYLKKA